MANNADLEKSPYADAKKDPSEELEARNGSFQDSDGAVPGHTFEYGDTLRARAMRFAGKFNIEQRGIERVPEDERHEHGTRGLLNAMTMWLSANMVVSTFAIGLLSNYVFYLGAADGMLVVLFFSILGVLPVCFFSTFGPRFGLRQMVLSRFWFGWWGVKLIAIFNVIACVGWSAVNAIVGAQLLNAVNGDLPGYAGILIISFCTFLVTLFGYKVVHAYEFWSWIPATIVWFIVLGLFAHSGDFVNIPWEVGTSELGGVLSYGSVVFGFAIGWTSYAADYTVYQPSTQSRWKLFLSTAVGLLVPLLFLEMLGVAVMTASYSPPNGPVSPYLTAYKTGNTGGVLGYILIRDVGTFGKFCLVVLAMTVVANNCPNLYTVSLTVQVLAHWTQYVPRFIWTLIGTGVSVAIAIPAYYHFTTVLEYFMDFIGYWLAIYVGIALTDHFVFRKGSTNNYYPELYDQPSKLPPGIAAVTAFCCGIAGMVTGMSQSWWVGPIALKAGEAPYGGDVGFELGFAFAAFAYLCLRPIEMRVFGR